MKICYKEKADQWTEALPIGNGRMGAMIYGGAEKEKIDLNEDTLWSGYPVREYRGLSRETYLQAKEYIKNGQNKEAMHVLEKKLCEAEDEEMYLPFGFLELKFCGERVITEYKRTLDLEQGIHTVFYKNKGQRYKQTAFASHPAECIVYRIQADEMFTLCISFDSMLQSSTEYRDNRIVLSGQCPGRCGFTIGDSERKQISHTYSEDDKQKGMRFEGRIEIYSEEGEILAEKEQTVCRNVKDILFVITLRTSFNGYQNHPFLEGKNEKNLLDLDKKRIDGRKSYDDLLKEHKQDYQALFQRVKLSLGTDAVDEIYPAEQLAFGYKNGGWPEFCRTLFDYGRYLLISSSREGTQAANLQGIWNCELVPPWFCDYTVNINTEMNYWLTGPCNLPELLEPLISLCRELTEAGKRVAEELYQSRGSVCFHNVDIWRKVTPANGKAVWSYWPFGLVWLCETLYDQSLFWDQPALLKKIFPMLHESTLFIIDLLEYTSDGYAVLLGTSPENEYYSEEDAEAKEKLSVSLYTENNNGLIRGLFRDYIEACKKLEIENELKYKVEKMLPYIAGPQIGTEGQILEWDKEYEETDVFHRHLSQLYAFHPGREWSKNTPEYYNAVRKSLERRGDEGTGWSIAWKLSMWARLEDGKHVSQIMKNMFYPVPAQETDSGARGGLYPNLFCAHPPFQIDGNLGFTAGVAEMLIQSHADEIVLLPGIPSEWEEGEALGFAIRGGGRISVKWKQSQVVFFSIEGKANEMYKVRYGEKTEKIQLDDNGKYCWKTETNNGSQ